MKVSSKARAAAILAAGVVTGGVLAGTLSANAASGATPTPTTPAAAGTAGTSGTSGTPHTPGAYPPPGRPGPGGASPVRSDEKLVTGSDLDTLRAAALKAVPGGTVIRIETDAGDAAYEAHMTKADGSLVTVKFDKNLAVTKVEQGMGMGDPRGGATTTG